MRHAAANPAMHTRRLLLSIMGNKPSLYTPLEVSHDHA